MIVRPQLRVGVDLHCEPSGDFPQSVLLDSSFLMHILLNLTQNSVQYTTTGSITLAITSSPCGARRLTNVGRQVAPIWARPRSSRSLRQARLLRLRVSRSLSVCGSMCVLVGCLTSEGAGIPFAVGALIPLGIAMMLLTVLPTEARCGIPSVSALPVSPSVLPSVTLRACSSFLRRIRGVNVFMLAFAALWTVRLFQRAVVYALSDDIANDTSCETCHGIALQLPAAQALRIVGEVRPRFKLVGLG
jgi:hypothetical protein